ncbi:MAG: P-II family nitrogen regulator [Bacilli bacterium]|jgi:nitrogen regulatory protein P-II 1
MESLSRVEIIMNVSKTNQLRKALGKFGISGMTVFKVSGCGVQNGTQEYEAEQKEEPTLIEKDMVMLVMPTKDVDDFIDYVMEELYTGHIGDGKIFVSDVSNVIRVRTGDEGYEAVVEH